MGMTYVKLRVKQNYPNLFNPSTISYSIPSFSFVTIKIHEILGKEKATFVNEEKSPGNYEVNFNVSKLPSGMFVYRLQSKNDNLVKKMMLVNSNEIIIYFLLAIIPSFISNYKSEFGIFCF